MIATVNKELVQKLVLVRLCFRLYLAFVSAHRRSGTTRLEKSWELVY